jgi:hypothetical protein
MEEIESITEKYKKKPWWHGSYNAELDLTNLASFLNLECYFSHKFGYIQY